LCRGTFPPRGDLACADGDKVLCLIPAEELRRRYKARPGLTGTEALAVFDPFRQELEGDIDSLLDRHGLSPQGEHGAGPLVLNLAAL
jgi:hypothetical protein